MANYVVVHAEFSKINPEDRESIYEYLDGESWSKVYTSLDKASTIWYAAFEDNVRCSDAIRISKK